VFDYCVSLNKFSPSPYFSKDISDRKELHDKVWELYSEGMGYTKIHQYLIKNGFEIGKSRTTVYHILKKLKKRKKVLEQNEIGTSRTTVYHMLKKLKKRKKVLSQNEVGKYRNFDLVWLEE
jgi:Fe2+ or Zn2+ uptake regulation protein